MPVELPVKKPDDAAPSSADNRLWTKDFVVITIANLLLFSGFQFFPSALPLYVKELGISDAVIGWISGLTTISALLIRPFGGMIVDRFGRKGILIVSLLIMIGASFSYSLFPYVAIILLIRFIHGIGWGTATTATSTIASDVIPVRRFGEGIGYFGLSGSFAMAVAPALSIMLFHSFGIESVSYLATAVLIGALVLSFFIHYKQVPKKPKSQVKVRTKLFEKNAVFPAFLIAFLTTTYGAITSFVAVYAMAIGITNIGLFFTVYAISVLVMRPFFGKLVDRREAHSVVLPGFLSAAAALLLLAFSTELWMFLIVGVLFGVAFGSLQSGLQTMAVASAPLERRGAANATYFVGFDVGMGLGSIVSGFLVTAVGYAHMYLIFAVVPIAALVVYFVYRKMT